MNLREDLLYIFQQSRALLWVLVLVIIPLLYLLSGFYSVGAEERGIVLRFGKIVREHVMPGMHYHLPWPIDSVQTIPATTLRSMEIDFSQDAPLALQPELTTGDEDLVDVSILVQYNIQDPGLYLASSQQTEVLLRQIAHAQTLYYISANAIDQLLTTGRTRFQNQLKTGIQATAVKWQLGIRITSVQIRRLEPPASIKKAFDNVARARSEKQKQIQESMGEKNTRLAQARSNANRIRQDASAFSTEVLERAHGDQEHFLATWQAYRQAPELTGLRLYLEKIESILDASEMTVVNPN
ncbi:Modulator of FtsH protease HflK [Thalassocella blandensis]|nr:Modulator of FtsH protease HflK [Thalassocella blandensis]